jgi:hypothetical protein
VTTAFVIASALGLAVISASGLPSARQDAAVGVGTVCLLSIADPTPGEKSLYNYTAGNPEPDYAVQFGDGVVVRMLHSPKGKGPGVLVTDLLLDQTYLVKVSLKGKRIESFRFRFEPESRGRVCLFLEEFYLTWQLWSASRLPSCTCRGASTISWKPS